MEIHKLRCYRFFRSLAVPVILLLTIQGLQAQNPNESAGARFPVPAHYAGDFSITAAPSVLFDTPNGTQFAGSIKIRMFMGKRISFDSDFTFANYYWHTGPGIFGIPIWLLFMGGAELSSPDLLAKLALMILSAEHTAYHIPVRDILELSPYISLLRIKSAYQIGNKDNPKYAGDQLCFVVGLELNKYFHRFQLSPYAEYQVGYRDRLSGFNIGLSMGIYFQSKSSK